MQYVVVNIPSLLYTSNNLKLYNLFEFGKKKNIDEDKELRDVY
jgi:hypothetical protein